MDLEQQLQELKMDYVRLQGDLEKRESALTLSSLTSRARYRKDVLHVSLPNLITPHVFSCCLY
ncbi:hypothetical protein B4W75_03655 [Staphylococcus intermedius]|nr:SE1832 family protein [Staphylococcus intermedius]PCF89954.1 hypothetical protein B4W75_03655 [Staphylococcus intermedius]